ncbi:MAG: TolC family protein [Rikenellaceae bacterium]|nr:TolC family protein [Rikenellaceae bacterium]
MKKYLFTTGIPALLACAGTLSGQDTWTLRECIDYALEHNIEIKQRELAVLESQVDMRDYRNARLPDLSAGISQNFSFGRAPSPETNTYADSQTSSTGVSASSSVPLYQGGTLRNRIKVGRLDLQAAVESLESARENLELQVAIYYLEVLYRRELLKVYQQELSLSQQQLERAEILVETGLSPRTELLETRAQVASNMVRVTSAAGDVENALLDLAQALNLDDFYGFDIAEPDLDAVAVDDFTLSSPGEVYSAALAVKPHIREMEYRLESSIANVRVARGSLYPTVSFGVSYSNGYSYVFSDSNESFAKQIRTRGNEAVGVNISIPIYNRGYTRSNIKRARLNVLSRELYLENTKLNIYKEIQQAWLDARNAVAEYSASEIAMEASQEAYKLMEESFNLGRTTALELEESRSKLIASLSEQVRSKYSFIFRSKILDFYMGVPITL